MLRLAVVTSCLLAACSSAVTTTSGGTSATTTAAAVTTSEPLLPAPLDGWETAEIGIGAPGGERQLLLVAVADEPAEREQGLMNVSDLLDLDGMLFVFDSDTASGFWMKNTLIGLDIAFFASDGSFVDRLTMEPCSSDPCPVYRPSGPYRYAVEVAAGDLASLAGDEVLVVAE